MRIEITLPESVAKKVGEFACECQRTAIDITEKEVRVFWKRSLPDVLETACKSWCGGLQS